MLLPRCNIRVYKYMLISFHKTLNKLDNKAQLVELFGRLALLSDDNPEEFKSLLDRINKRIDTYYVKTRI